MPRPPPGRPNAPQTLCTACGSICYCLEVHQHRFLCHNPACRFHRAAFGAGSGTGAGVPPPDSTPSSSSSHGRRGRDDRQRRRDDDTSAEEEERYYRPSGHHGHGRQSPSRSRGQYDSGRDYSGQHDRVQHHPSRGRGSCHCSHDQHHPPSSHYTQHYPSRGRDSYPSSSRGRDGYPGRSSSNHAAAGDRGHRGSGRSRRARSCSDSSLGSAIDSDYSDGVYSDYVVRDRDSPRPRYVSSSGSSSSSSSSSSPRYRRSAAGSSPASFPGGYGGRRWVRLRLR